MMEENHPAVGKLPDHLLIEIFVRVPICDWTEISCVNHHWAAIFRGECLWQTAITRTWPSAGHRKRWPGPIPRGFGRRRYTSLYVSQHIIALDGETDELLGHAFLFLKEQLEHSTLPPPSSILHGTIIGLTGHHIMFIDSSGEWIWPLLPPSLDSIQYRDQFIACGKSRDSAHELASQIWLAVINNLEETDRTFLLLKRLAQEGDYFLPYPYSRSYKVLWRVFEKLLTDFRDCLSRADYCEVLSCAKSRFQPIPSAWLGY